MPKKLAKAMTGKKAWVADRKNRYEPKFEELFNKGMEGQRSES